MAISCREAARKIASDEITESRWTRLSAWLHLFHCPLCRRYMKQLRAIGDGARNRWRLGQESEIVEKLERQVLERSLARRQDSKESE